MLKQDQIEAILDDLPHGSGIDRTWRHEVKGNRDFFTNSFHCMDDNGSYAGWQDFQIVVSTHDKDYLNALKGPLEGMAQVVFRKGDLDWKLELTGIANYYARKNGLRDYLNDVFRETMHKMGIKPPLRERVLVNESEASYPPMEETTCKNEVSQASATKRDLYLTKQGEYYEVRCARTCERLRSIHIDPFPENMKDAIERVERDFCGEVSNFNKEDGKIYGI